MACESALRQYFAAIDGTKKDFSEVQHLFDALYHDDFTLVFKDGETTSRDDMKEVHAGYLSEGSKVTLIHFTFHLVTVANS